MNYSYEKLERWVSQKIIEQLYFEKRKDQAAQETQSTFNQAIFHPIKAGSFTYKLKSGLEIDRKIEILQDFEMQSTHVTQGQWIELMGVNPSFGKESVPLEFINHPVTNITLWSAMEYANRLSIRDGYEPVYDFKNFNLTGDPADGSSGVGSATNDGLIINAPEGDIYQAEGYRLPTLAEYYMVTSNRGQFGSLEAIRDFFEINDPLDYFNFSERIDSTSVEVDALKPIDSNGHDFYGLRGNVQAFASDRAFMPNKFISGENPLSLYTKHISSGVGGFAIYGKSHSAELSDILQFYGRDHAHDTESSQFLGIRLVRTLKPGL